MSSSCCSSNSNPTQPGPEEIALKSVHRTGVELARETDRQRGRRDPVEPQDDDDRILGHAGTFDGDEIETAKLIGKGQPSGMMAVIGGRHGRPGDRRDDKHRGRQPRHEATRSGESAEHACNANSK